MQRKIKLEEISPYLPYGLKMREKDLTYVLAGLNQGYMLLYEYGDPSQEIFDAEMIEQSVKPIVRPLSDLIKEIEHNGKRFVPVNYLSDNNPYTDDIDNCAVSIDGTIEMYYWREYQKLFEWHFDVFGFLKDGIAVNINGL